MFDFETLEFVAELGQRALEQDFRGAMKLARVDGQRRSERATGPVRVAVEAPTEVAERPGMNDSHGPLPQPSLGNGPAKGFLRPRGAVHSYDDARPGPLIRLSVHGVTPSCPFGLAASANDHNGARRVLGALLADGAK